jgi:hypothetical protein
MPFTDGVVLDLGWLAVLRDLDAPHSPNQIAASFSRSEQSARDAHFRNIIYEERGTGLSNLLLSPSTLLSMSSSLSTS